MIDDPVLANDWHAVAWASELAAGQAKPVRLLEDDVVIWRNRDGVHAWQDLCVHRGSRLSFGRVVNDCLACPYHGWEYDSSGRCVRIPAHPGQPPPARAHTTVYLVKECYGLVWVCLGNPAQDVPAFPEWEDASFSKIPAGPYLYRAHGPRVIDNFLDVAHFPFVHMGFWAIRCRPRSATTRQKFARTASRLEKFLFGSRIPTERESLRRLRIRSVFRVR